MKKMKFGLIVLIGTMMVAACSTDNDVYNPKADAQKKNPLKLTTTDDFTWENLQKVGITVKVADQYSATYTYGVEVFDKNPITAKDATLLAQGTATGKKDFFVSLEIGKGTSTLFVRQTSPTGVKLVKSAVVESTTAIVDFNEKYTASATKVTRAKSDWTLPATPADSNFPTSAPADAQTPSGSTISAAGNYILTSSVRSVSGSNVNLYVNGNVTLSFGNDANSFITGSNVNIYILPGAKLTVDARYRWVLEAEKATIYVGEGGQLVKTGEFPEIGLKKNSAIYNRGKVELRLIEASDNAILYNLATGELKCTGNNYGKLTFFGNSFFVNDGTTTTDEFNEVRDDRAGNVYNFGTMNVTGMTHISATYPVWVNEGKWTTENFDYAEKAQPVHVINKCCLTVKNKMEVYALFTVDAHGSVVTKDLLMTKGGVNLRSGALFRVDGTAEYKHDDGVFTGVGEEKALLIMNCATTKASAAVGSSQYPHYRGNLVVACDNYVGTMNVTTAGGALLTSDVNNTGVNIPVTECNPGHVETPPAPTPVDYQYAVSFSGIYAIEDEWPDFGDYDMNDAVVKLVLTASGNGAASSEAEAKNIPLTKVDVTATFMAVGAERDLGAYVQLDNVVSSAATLTGANGIGLEGGQSKVVLKLNENIARLLGGKYVNVIGERSTARYKTVTGTLSIPAGIHAADISFDKVNFFITVGDAGTGKRKEVHLKNFVMTDKGASSGDSFADKYQTADNFVWGICVPGESYDWPDERVSIKDVNNDFVNWVTSGGTAGLQWYKANVNENVTTP
ncbi:LruC domain-containing protein [Bacteroides heparinolyticus]|uniref:LruC domain-containing protein n=1 Tax=Prevotella heparinolytica TaxID=28113 RepID=UPI003FA0A044